VTPAPTADTGTLAEESDFPAGRAGTTTDPRVIPDQGADRDDAGPDGFAGRGGADQTGENDATAETDGGGVAAIIRRRLAPFDARLDPYSWFATALVTLIAGTLRLVGLADPKGKIFDEVYYAVDAHNLLVHGVEWDDKNNTAGYVVHPPLGKWIIGVGEKLFGYSEFGWRISAAVIGTISVLMLVRIARRMFGSTVLGCAAGLLMAFDGMHFVLSRTALLDIFLMFFILAAFGALVLDRDSRRRRWLNAITDGMDPSQRRGANRPPFNWRTSVPWWRLASAALIGCALSVKWSALWFLPAFAILIMAWEIGARRTAGVRHPWRDTFLDETGWLVLSAAIILVVYLSSWSGWFLTSNGYFRHWLADNGKPEPPIWGALLNLIHYHQEAYKFHSTLTTHHTYQSWPWQWLLLGRPVAFFWSSDGTCSSSSCASEVLLLGTPVLWWSFLPALATLAWLGISRRDWRAGSILLGVAAGLLPWFYFALDGRTMFYFYALPAEPFLVLAVVYVLGAIMNPVPRPGAPATAEGLDAGGIATIGGIDRRVFGAVLLGAYVLLVAACFAYFYPIYVGKMIPYDAWSARMWLGGRWI
jgi:dolichyl-phosphate-mannose--protein O-mannosyl transferase